MLESVLRIIREIIGYEIPLKTSLILFGLSKR